MNRRILASLLALAAIGGLTACTSTDTEGLTEATYQTPAYITDSVLSDPSEQLYQTDFNRYKNGPREISDRQAQKYASEDYFFQTGGFPDPSWPNK